MRRGADDTRLRIVAAALAVLALLAAIDAQAVRRCAEISLAAKEAEVIAERQRAVQLEARYRALYEDWLGQRDAIAELAHECDRLEAGRSAEGPM